MRPRLGRSADRHAHRFGVYEFRQRPKHLRLLPPFAARPLGKEDHSFHDHRQDRSAGIRCACLNAAASISLATSSVLLTVSMSSLFLEDRDSRKRDEAGVAAPLTAPQSAAGLIRRDLADACFVPVSACWGLRYRDSRSLFGRRKETNFPLDRPAECSGACKMAG